MKIKEVTEAISRIGAGEFPGGKDELYDISGPRYPLPGGSGLTFNLKKSSYAVEINIYSSSGEIVGGIYLNPMSIGPMHGYKVGTITVDEKYRKMGIGMALYGLFFTQIKAPLFAGESQTPGGRK